ncbi:MAG: serine/threonine protein kinase [Deltaproteobacteria bacterium]|nr:serine/threonine protein kinase [Deltaproteobacteria bacterium]
MSASPSRYRLVRLIGTGGMAEIWLAVQRGTSGFRRCVAVKKILPHLARQEAFVAMFLDEAKRSAQLHHRNIVQIHDLGRDDGSYFMAMEYIAGENLSDIRRRAGERGRPLTYGLIARIAADVAQALSHAHAQGLVHRDISPQNILIGYDGVTKVVDFGIAKAMSVDATTTSGVTKGKAGYMSPEQCLGRPIDVRTDIFSLGIVLYELATGTALFRGSSEFLTMEKITRCEIPAPETINPGIPPQLAQIAMRALAKSPNDRYPTANAMLEDLEALMERTEHGANVAALSEYVSSIFAGEQALKQASCNVALDAEAEPTVAEVARKEAESTRQVTILEVPESGRSSVGEPFELQDIGIENMKSDSSSTRKVRGVSALFTPLPYGSPAARIVATPPEEVDCSKTRLLAPPKRDTPWPTRLFASGLTPTFTSTWWTAKRRESRRRPALWLGVVVMTSILGLLMGVLLSRPPATAGAVVVESVPAGATVLIDGLSIRRAGEGSAIAVTPYTLSNLQEGKAVTLTLTLDGYQPFERRFDVRALLDRGGLKVRLKRRTARSADGDQSADQGALQEAGDGQR